jgi:NTE family protein
MTRTVCSRTPIMNANLVIWSMSRQVGRVTPRAPVSATRPRSGAHEVTRPARPTTAVIGAFKKSIGVALGSIILISLTGCAHYTVNAPKLAASTDGYYYRNHKRENQPDDILLLMAFSGGGTRAAAFSYGVLEALRDTTFEVEGKKRRLLDEVDAISSVSGGSVTAAAYGLYGNRVFDVYEPAFLKRNVERALLGHVLNPVHWPALWSPDYGRSDMAAKYYDKILFKNACFRDLATNNTPYLIINGTDIVTGTRIGFTQYLFDLLGSDLDTYPISRAVAASSGVPGVLTPITLNNYSGEHPAVPPAWLAKPYGPDAGMAGRQVGALKLFLNSTNYPYLHLVDGGVSDNLGLRVYLELLSYLGLNPELMHQGSLEKVRKVIFISVNAYVRDEKSWDRKAKTPGSIPVAIAADAVTMRNYSTDTLAWLAAAIEKLRSYPDLKNKVDFYAIDLSFDQLRDRSEVAYFLSLPTTFFLKSRVVDDLKSAAHTLLYQNPNFKRLMTDLGASPTSLPTGRAGEVK